jgi:hypothetical protein
VINEKTRVAFYPPTSNQLAECPNYPEPCFCTGACQPNIWDEKRIDTIGQNGNTGDHYE